MTLYFSYVWLEGLQLNNSTRSLIFTSHCSSVYYLTFSLRRYFASLYVLTLHDILVWNWVRKIYAWVCIILWLGNVTFYFSFMHSSPQFFFVYGDSFGCVQWGNAMLYEMKAENEMMEGKKVKRGDSEKKNIFPWRKDEEWNNVSRAKARQNFEYF